MGSQILSEVEKFEQYAHNWWNMQSAEFKLLHKINPLRIGFIQGVLKSHFAACLENINSTKPLQGLKILDVGCGGGLATIALNQLGASVIGIDPGKSAILAANNKARDLGLQDIEHICIMPEDFKSSELFDVVVCLDVIEHVQSIEQTCAVLRNMVKLDGAIIISTINRNLKSLMLGIVAAEYLLRMLPVGTHAYEKFVKPSQLQNILINSGFKIKKLQGIGLKLPYFEWGFIDDISVNYLAYFAAV